MNDIGFSFLSNPPLGVAANADTNQNSTSDNPIPATPGLVHYQTKLDVFLIKAFSLLSSGAIIDSNNMQISGDTGAMTAPGTTNLSAGPEGFDSVTSTVGSDVISEPTPNGLSPLSSLTIINSYSQYAHLFGKVSVLYNAILTTTPVDERSTSSKSSIELFQRFKQIIKELCLNYDMSPYAKYFNRIDQNLLQVKSDSELESDELWNFATKCILSVYDPKTGKLLTANSRSRRIMPLNQKVPVKTATFPKSSTNNNDKKVRASPQVSPDKHSGSSGSASSKTSGSSSKQAKKPRKKYTRKKHTSGTTAQKKSSESSSAPPVNNSLNGENTNELPTDFSADLDLPNTGGNPMSTVTQQASGPNEIGMTTSINSNFNMNVDTLFPQILQRRLQNIPQDIYSRPLTGYYTQPTSPGSDNNNFNLGFIPTDSVNTPSQFDNFGITLGGVPGYNDNNAPNSNSNSNDFATTSVSLNPNPNPNSNSNPGVHQQHLLHPHGRPTSNNITGTVSAGPTTPQAKRRSRSSLNVSTLDDSVVDELFQFANLNRKQKITSSNDNTNTAFSGTNISNTQPSGLPATDLAAQREDSNGDVGGVSLEDIKRNYGGVLGTNRKNISGGNDSSNSNNQIGSSNDGDSNCSNSGGNIYNTRRMENFSRERPIDADGDNNRIKRQDTRSVTPGIYRQTAAVSQSGIPEVDTSGSQPHGAAVIAALERTTQQLKETYQARLTEKDQRIRQLEKELEDQRQETEWLRKMLVGDIGYIRGLLQNSQK